MGYGKTICTCKLCNGKTVHVDTARKHARNWKRKREAEIDAEENISTEIAIAIDGKNDADIAIDTAFDANDDADHDESKALNSAPDSDLESDPDPEAKPTSQSTLLARSLLDLVANNKAKQGGMVDTCRSFQKYIPPTAQGTGDDEINIARTFEELKKIAGMHPEGDLGLKVVDICGCFEHVFNPEVDGEVLSHCPVCSKARNGRGRKIQMLICSVVKKLQRMWAVPEIAKFLHYAAERNTVNIYIYIR